MLEQPFNAPYGLWSQASFIGEFSVAACHFQAKVEISCGGQTVNGKSVLGLLSLRPSPSDPFTLRISGPDEQEAMCCLSKLLHG